MSQSPEVNEGNDSPIRVTARMYALIIGCFAICSMLYSLFLDRSTATGPMFKINCVYTVVCVFVALAGAALQSPALKWLGIVFGSIGLGMVLASPILMQL